MDSIEIFLHDEADTLCVQAILSEVTVVRLVVHSDRQVTIGEYEIPKVKITDETLGCIGVVSIAKLTVEKQPVVK